MADDVFGFIADDVDRIRNVVSYVEKSPRYTRKERRYTAPPQAVAGCDCCPPCCGTLWKVVNDEIVWSVDFYEGLPQSEIDNWYSTGGPAPIGTTCDIDSNGNVYHTGDRFSRKLVTSISRPQPAMYSLKSYDSNGTLNWSYAKYPNGFVSGGVRANDYGTTKVRCGGANVFSAYAGLTGSDCYLIRHNTSTGVPIWDINATAIERGYGDANVLIGAGPTRILLTGYGEATTHYPIIVLDHDGSFVWGEQTNTIEPVWIDDNDVQYGIDRIGTTPDGDKVVSWDADGTFLNVPIIRDGFQPLRLRTLGDQLVCSNGTEIRLYTINGTGNYTQKITSTESLMVFSDRVGSKTEFITRLRSATDLSTAYFFYPPTTNSVGDDYLFSDAMPFDAGTIWCGRRVCGKTLEPDVDTPTTTSTTTPSTTGSSTTGSSTTGSSTTGSSTTSSSSTTGTTGSTTTGSTTESTTTSGCVVNGCTWTWLSGVWVNTSSTCVVPCAACVTQPIFSGSIEGETATTNCEISI